MGKFGWTWREIKEGEEEEGIRRMEVVDEFELDYREESGDEQHWVW